MPNKMVLLVEDDYDVAEMLVMYFRSHDFDVLHADNGTDGLELARTKFPNLVLLDVMLPDMDGYDVCVKLRQTALTKFIPILFLTQKDERASKVRGLELGVDDYITKPFDIDELRLRVQGTINRATRESLHEPRTGLPTGPMLEDEISRKLIHDEPFIQMRYRVEGFRIYQDLYGFLAANDVLNHAGTVIQRTTGELGTQYDFVGIVDDDLILLTSADDIETLDEEIKARFSEEVRAFYSFIDADRGGVMVDEGTDSESFEPLMYFSSERQQLAML